MTLFFGRLCRLSSAAGRLPPGPPHSRAGARPLAMLSTSILVSLCAYALAIHLLIRHRHDHDVLAYAPPTFSPTMVAWEYPTAAAAADSATWTGMPPRPYASLPLVALPLACLEQMASALGALVSATCAQRSVTPPHRLRRHLKPAQNDLASLLLGPVAVAPITAASAAATATVLASMAELARRPAPQGDSPSTAMLVPFVALRVALVLGGLVLARSPVVVPPTTVNKICTHPLARIAAAVGGMCALVQVSRLTSLDHVLGGFALLAATSTLAILSASHGHGHGYRAFFHHFVACIAIASVMASARGTNQHSIFDTWATLWFLVPFAVLVFLSELAKLAQAVVATPRVHVASLAACHHVVRDVASVLLVSVLAALPLSYADIKLVCDVPSVWTGSALILAGAFAVVLYKSHVLHDPIDWKRAKPHDDDGHDDKGSHDDPSHPCSDNEMLQLPLTRPPCTATTTTASRWAMGRCFTLLLVVLAIVLLGLGLSQTNLTIQHTHSAKQHAKPKAAPLDVAISQLPGHLLPGVTPAHHAGRHVRPQVDTLIRLVPDASLAAPTPGHKAAKVFAVNATLARPASNPRSSALVFEARVPTLDTWPRRAWDHARSAPPPVQLNQMWFAAGGNPSSFERNRLAARTFGNESGMQYRVYWSQEDDRVGATGLGGELVDQFRHLVQGARAIKALVIMQGEPERANRTMHRKWFKMLAHMYESAPAHVHWFLVGDDDTVWFPHVLAPLLASQPLDPTKDSAYLGDVSESIRQTNKYGQTMGFGGGGVAISRALAARVYNKLDWCLHSLDDFYGDGLLRSCIENVTRVDRAGPAVTLTRVPVFNQVDLFQWHVKGREFFSARFSRAAPATLHHMDLAPPLVAGIEHRAAGTFKMWHVTRHMPVALMFRRFFVHLPADAGATERGTRTAVVTYGLHVRVYRALSEPLHVDHAVDWDSAIPTTPEFVGTEWVAEDARVQTDDPETWPERNLHYDDYWLAEVDEIHARMVYVDDKSGKRLALQVQCPLPTGGARRASNDRVDLAAARWAMYSMCL